MKLGACFRLQSFAPQPSKFYLRAGMIGLYRMRTKNSCLTLLFALASYHTKAEIDVHDMWIEHAVMCLDFSWAVGGIQIRANVPSW